MCQHVESTAVVNFLDHDYCYKSVVTQVPYDTVLTAIRSAGDLIRDRCVTFICHTVAEII